MQFRALSARIKINYNKFALKVKTNGKLNKIHYSAYRHYDDGVPLRFIRPFIAYE